MDESTAKGILKYLKELGVPATPADVAARGQQQGWSAGFTDKVAEWAERVAAGERLVIKHRNSFPPMREELRALCNRRASTPPLQLNAFPYWKAFLLLPSIAAARGFDQVMSVLSRWAQCPAATAAGRGPPAGFFGGVAAEGRADNGRERYRWWSAPR